MKCRACNIEMEKHLRTRHYQSETHAENMVRKGLGLPPAPEKEKAQAGAEQKPGEEKSPTSTKKRSTRKKEEDTPEKYPNEEYTYALAHGECFYCGLVIDIEEEAYYTTEKYLEHLEEHGFRLLRREDLRDIHGLLGRIKEKIEHCMCTFCNKRFSRMESTREHMNTESHARYVNTEDYDEFYEYPEKPAAYLSEDGSELLMASGRVIGHKKYAKYYAQTLREENFYTNMDTIHIRHQQQMVKKELPPQTKEEVLKINQHKRVGNKNALKVGKAGNVQKHYREDWMQ